MNDSQWEENIGLLIKRCSRPITDRQIEESAARFERKLKPRSPVSRASLIAAVIAFVGIALWIILPSLLPVGSRRAGLTQRTQEQDNQKRKDEIDTLIVQLGSGDKEVRERAEAKLLVFGVAALEALDKGYYHENPDVRQHSKDLAKRIRDRSKVEEIVAGILARIKIVRARWTARDFKDIEQVTRDAFKPALLEYVRYVPKKEMGDHLETDDGDPIGGFRPIDSRGGNRDRLTREVAKALDGNPGVVFLMEDENGLGARRGRFFRGSSLPREKPIAIGDSGRVFLFTLPDKKEWSAYMVVGITEASFANAGQLYSSSFYKSALLSKSDSRQVWLMDAQEIEWALAHLDWILDADLDLAENPERGLVIERIAEGSIGAARGLLPGDILKEINDQAIRKVEDVKRVICGPAMEKATALQVTLERAGKPFVLEFRPLSK
jgi:hypothetical protein